MHNQKQQAERFNGLDDLCSIVRFIIREALQTNRAAREKKLPVRSLLVLPEYGVSIR